jgi:hypothetical protein
VPTAGIKDVASTGLWLLARESLDGVWAIVRAVIECSHFGSHFFFFSLFVTSCLTHPFYASVADQ